MVRKIGKVRMVINTGQILGREPLFKPPKNACRECGVNPAISQEIKLCRGCLKILKELSRV